MAVEGLKGIFQPPAIKPGKEGAERRRPKPKKKEEEKEQGQGGKVDIKV